MRGGPVARVRLLAALCLLAACRPARYARYGDPQGAFSCDVPAAWDLRRERDGIALSGPFDPDFHDGIPELRIRFHPRGEYASLSDLVERTLRLHGPERVVLEPPRPVEVAGRRGVHFVVLCAVPVRPGAVYGVAVEEGGRRLACLRQHAYAAVEADGGFFVLEYPATRQGYERYAGGFHRLVNSFRLPA